MRPRQITDHLRKRPFVPLRIHISNGSHFDVSNPEMVVVSQREVAIGVAPFEEDVPIELAYCDPLHITHIEPINGDSSGGNGTGSG